MQALTQLRSSEAFALALRGWDWWVGELAGLIPRGLQWRAAGRPKVEFRLLPDRVQIDILDKEEGRRLVDPRPLDALDEDAWGELSSLLTGSEARLVLTGSDCFSCELRLPKAAASRLRAAVLLQLSAISPLDANAIFWSAEAFEADGETVRVAVSMVRKDRVRHVQSLFADRQIPCPSIFVESAEQLRRIVDLPHGRKSIVDNPNAKWIAAALLLLATIPASTVTGAKLLRASADRRAYQLEREIRPRIALEKEARKAEAVRRSMRPAFSEASVSQTVEELSAQLPSTDYVKAVERTADRSLQITVETPGAEAAQEALTASPLFKNIELLDLQPAEADRIRATYRVVTTP